GEHGFHLGETAGQNETQRAGAIVTWKSHAQHQPFRLAVTQGLVLDLHGDAYIAIHQAQVVIIARHQHRPPLVPDLAGIEQTAVLQNLANTPVHPFSAPGSLAYRTEHLKAVEGHQYRARPVLPGGTGRRRVCTGALVSQYTEI